MPGKISAKQKEILEYIKAEILNKGYPPAVREICEAVKLKSTSSVQADNDWRYTWENILNYSKTFGKHGLTAMIGSSTTAYGYEKVLASGANQASALTSFHDLGANADSKENASQLIETQMVSFFGRLNYKFNERYLFQASLRADGSSVLAKGHKWGYFPSAAADCSVADVLPWSGNFCYRSSVQPVGR